MRLISQTAEHATLQLAAGEAATLCNALNEALECLDDWEFEIRMGASRAEVQRLLSEFNQIHFS